MTVGDVEGETSLPRGPGTLCLDAMVLIHWNNAGHLDLLGRIVGRALTANVILEEEIKGAISAFPQNQRIVDAAWLESAKVEDGDGKFVADLLLLWDSPPYRDRGEAEIVALCRRHGWTAITDDRDGRSALEAKGLNYAYMSSLLLGAGVMGVAGLDEDSAWAIHHEVESRRDGPRLYGEGKFKKCIGVVQRLWEQSGRPSWPEFMKDWRIDFLVDRADNRKPSRLPR